jgi:hypothetical protein
MMGLPRKSRKPVGQAENICGKIRTKIGQVEKVFGI